MQPAALAPVHKHQAGAITDTPPAHAGTLEFGIDGLRTTREFVDHRSRLGF
jgi:hypothetical protein